MKRSGRVEEIVTDRFTSYRAAPRELGVDDCRVNRRWQNNRVETHTCPPAKRTADTAFQAHAKSAEVGLRPFFRL